MAIKIGGVEISEDPKLLFTFFRSCWGYSAAYVRWRQLGGVLQHFLSQDTVCKQSISFFRECKSEGSTPEENHHPQNRATGSLGGMQNGVQHSRGTANKNRFEDILVRLQHCTTIVELPYWQAERICGQQNWRNPRNQRFTWVEVDPHQDQYCGYRKEFKSQISFEQSCDWFQGSEFLYSSQLSGTLKKTGSGQKHVF